MIIYNVKKNEMKNFTKKFMKDISSFRFQNYSLNNKIYTDATYYIFEDKNDINRQFFINLLCQDNRRIIYTLIELKNLFSAEEQKYIFQRVSFKTYFNEYSDYIQYNSYIFLKKYMNFLTIQQKKDIIYAAKNNTNSFICNDGLLFKFARNELINALDYSDILLIIDNKFLLNQLNKKEIKKLIDKILLCNEVFNYTFISILPKFIKFLKYRIINYKLEELNSLPILYKLEHGGEKRIWDVE